MFPLLMFLLKCLDYRGCRSERGGEARQCGLPLLREFRVSRCLVELFLPEYGLVVVRKTAPLILRLVTPDEPEDKSVKVCPHRVGHVLGNNSEGARIRPRRDNRQDAFRLLAKPVEECFRLLFGIVETSDIVLDVVQLVRAFLLGFPRKFWIEIIKIGNPVDGGEDRFVKRKPKAEQAFYG